MGVQYRGKYVICVKTQITDRHPIEVCDCCKRVDNDENITARAKLSDITGNKELIAMFSLGQRLASRCENWLWELGSKSDRSRETRVVLVIAPTVELLMPLLLDTHHNPHLKQQATLLNL